MHAGRVSSSERLTLILTELRKAGSRGATTRQLIQATGMCAINSCISEIRANGFDIRCTCDGRNEHGSMVYRYTLMNAPGGQGELFGRTA